SIEPQVGDHDDSQVKRLLNDFLNGNTDVCYVSVRGPEGRSIKVEASEPMLPLNALNDWMEEEGEAQGIQEYTFAGGTFLVSRTPLDNERYTSLEVVMAEPGYRTYMNEMLRHLAWGMLLSVTLGMGLASLLTHLLAYPIRHLEQTALRIGAGEFGARARVFNGDEIGRLAATVNQMGEYLQEYRRAVQEKEAIRASLIERIVHATEEERKSVARELHDQLGQSLSYTLLKLQQLPAETKADKKLRSELEDDIREQIDEVRRLAQDLRPPILDKHGLKSALHRQTSQVSRQLGIPIGFRCAGAPAQDGLLSAVEVTLYRIAQEALTNIVRHAKATSVSVVLIYEGESVSLVVEDNGCGFDVDAHVQSQDSLGIVGMKERAAFVGGEVEIESTPGQGVGVFVRIPAEDATDANSCVSRR
ncbi:MAG: histidine kinase, partial [Candidatus Hydrogenedentes bacterium]|nr:histidine kinase [Candidatus Hydrogenedentota bacterium]